MTTADTLVETAGRPEAGRGTTHVDPAASIGTVPSTSRADRTTSFDVADFPVPTGREEEWRFTPVKKVASLLQEGTTAHSTWQVEVQDGVTSTVLTAAAARDLGILAPQDRAAAIAAAGAQEVVFVDVAAEVELDAPVRLSFVGVADTVTQTHVVVRAGHHSRATVLLDHHGAGAVTELVSVLSGDSADLTVVSAQRWDDTALHLGQTDCLVGRDARLRHIAVTLGGEIVRLNVNVRYAGPGGDATLLGVYFADSGQHLEHRPYIDHNAPRCKSLVTYKGALQGETARTVWVGDALIRAAAEGTDTYELNRNLILTDGARADSVPNLEIETGEIEGAGHASATGRFDDLQLFYLQARGIPEEEAKRLVVRGFFAEIIREIPVADLADEITAAIEEELSSSAYADPALATTDSTDSTHSTTAEEN